jgi:putative oxidoreductase
MHSSWLEIAARLALGLQFAFFGLNGFLRWFAVPEPRPAFAKFVQALDDTKFILPVIKIIEIICGIVMAIGLWVDLATMLLGAILCVVVSTQLVLNRSRGLVISLQLLVPFVIVVFCHWTSWQILLFADPIFAP